jgi:hypothetical protein
MLVYVRPSNEALLRARVPGAQDQYGCPSHLSDRAASASKKDGLATSFPHLQRVETVCETRGAHQGLFHKRPWWP